MRLIARRNLASLACMGAVALVFAQVACAQQLPSRLSDSTFWKLITDYSEPGGYFR